MTVCLSVCLRQDDIAGVPGVVNRCPLTIQSYSQKTLPHRVQTSATNYAHLPPGKLTSSTPPCHAVAPPSYRAVTSFKAADCDTGNGVTAPGNRSGSVTGSRASAVNRFAEVGERPLTARHVVAVRLLERTNNAGDLTRR